MMLRKYATNIKRLKKEFKENVRLNKYWNKVENEFIKHKKKLDREFIYEFKREYEYDDKARIESVASTYGYKIVDEDLRTFKSVYKFMRIEREAKRK